MLIETSGQTKAPAPMELVRWYLPHSSFFLCPTPQFRLLMTIFFLASQVTIRKKERIDGHEETFEALFADDAGTSSGALSLQSEPTTVSFPLNGVTRSDPSFCGGAGGVPITRKLHPDVQAAVKYLSGGNGEKYSCGKELLIFTQMLCNVDFLVENFHLMPDDYVKRRSSLIDVFVS